jgi:GTPase SAR1 family protein
MAKAFEYDVFISHSSKDKTKARGLAQRLKADGLNVTWDKGKLEQARTLVLCMSPAYFDSEWGTLEHHTLLFRDPTDAQRRFIPLLFEDCTPPDIIAQFATIDWRTLSDEAYDKLLAACRGDDEGGEPPALEEKGDQSRMVLRGHTDSVIGVAVTPDGQTVISGSRDKTLKVWDLATGHCRATFEGHTSGVTGVAVTPDGKSVVSGSEDNKLKVWDLATGHCRATLEGHTHITVRVAITPDGKTVTSGSWDNTVRVWHLPQPDARGVDVHAVRYTNAKVVLVGETGVGKTGLALRLCEDRWEPTESTHGMIVSKLELPADTPSGMEREVWLWDFAGQPDYRLIHQLYMDETALGVLVFDPQDDNPFEDIGYWEKALRAATKYEPAKLLVAGRCDRGGITISRRRFEQYVQEQGFAGFLSTGAKTGDGCQELKAAIAQHIPWQRLPWTATSQLFKTLKDAVLKLTEEDAPLVRLPELRQRLQLTLPEETISEADLRAVVGLMQGQGVVQRLDFGDFVLLQPEHINRYASVVVRMAREHADEMGVVPEQQVLDGRLDYKGMERLAEADEKILLRAMVQTFLDRSLCLREETPRGTMLVFPSYFRRDKPGLPEHPNVFVTYGFAGPLEEIYTSLVVRLSYSDGFEKDELWKNAADFKTPEGKRVGLAMTKKAEGAAEIVVYFEGRVPDDTKVTFIKYVHEHLLARAQPREQVTRVRTYVCPHCDTPLGHQMIEKRLAMRKSDIICGVCEERMELLDLIEEKFASDEFLRRVRELDERARINLDNESRELILVGHAIAIAAEAGQIFRPVAWADWGIDGEIEFKDHEGKASGQRVYLQLKSGDSYLYHRQRDDVEVFTIKKKRWAEYWLSQAYPVMLVIRTSDGQIRWMNVTDYLQEHGPATKQIVFEGEPFTALNVARLRDRVLAASELRR